MRTSLIGALASAVALSGCKSGSVTCSSNRVTDKLIEALRKDYQRQYPDGLKIDVQKSKFELKAITTVKSGQNNFCECVAEIHKKIVLNDESARIVKAKNPNDPDGALKIYNEETENTVSYTASVSDDGEKVSVNWRYSFR